MRRSPLRSARSRSAHSQRGFSILELVIALFIAVEILIAMAIAFDVHNKISRVQLQITDMQQSLRIAQWDLARLARMAGRGGLKADLEPGAAWDDSKDPLPIRGRAIEIRNNVTGDERFIARGDDTSPSALEGTDILTVRGCFGTLFQIDSGTFDASDTDGDGTPGDENGETTLEIPAVSVAGVPQPFADLEAELTDHPGVGGVFGRILLSSFVSRDDWGIAKVVDLDSDDDTLTLTVALDSEPDDALSPLNPRVPSVTGSRSFPTTITASTACLLEEYRYYVRDVREAGDTITPLRPRLTRARFEPGTEDPYQGDTANYSIDLADQVFDLQVALGLDTDYWSGNDTSQPGSFEADNNDFGLDEVIYEAAADSASPGRSQDDWLYNDENDSPGCDPTEVDCDATGIPYLYHAYSTIDDDPVDVYFVRITTAARTYRPDPSYEAPDLDTRSSGDWLEDHDHDTPASDGTDFNSDDNRRHRRRTLTTTVEPRNI
jgi:hypothetical protein